MKHSAWTALPLERLSETISRRLITGEKLMAAMVELKQGAIVPLHHHESEQITYVVNGWLRFTFEDGHHIDVREGEVLVIPSNVEHSAEALEDTVDLDYFSPIREDWLSGGDAYLRG